MKKDKRIITCIVYVFLGVILLYLGIAEVIDAYWSGMGSALIAVGVIRSIHFFRYRNDETYREKLTIERSDERNRFIRNKAWAWAGYLFILLAAVFSIVFKLMGQDLLSMASGFSVCIMMILYWICYVILFKKY